MADVAAAAAAGPGHDASRRRAVVATGHDDELQVLWVRLDALPDAGWVAAFDQERDACEIPFVRHGRHLLCTSTAEASRRLTKTARRLVGATNGRVSGEARPQVLAS